MNWILKVPKNFKKKSIVGSKIINGLVEVKQQFYAKFLEKAGFKVIQKGKVTYADPKEILILRGGGFGDLLMALPAISALKQTYPKAKIDVWCPTVVGQLLQQHPDINKVVAWLPQYVGLHASLYDVVVDFSTIIPNNIEAEYKNAYDLHFEWLGFNPKKWSKVPELYFTKEEEQVLTKGIKRLGLNLDEDEIIICCFHSSSILRNYPYNKGREIINLLAERYPEKKFLLVGDVGNEVRHSHRFFCQTCGKELNVALNKIPTVPVEAPYICEKCNTATYLLPAGWKDEGEKQVTHWYTLPENLYEINMSTRELAMVIKKAELVVSVDTAPLHIAGAVGTTALGIFSSFLASTRLGYFEKANWIQGKYKCAPCFQHGVMCQNAARQDKKHALCMDAISPEEVVEKVIGIFEEGKIYRKEDRISPNKVPQACPICYSQKTVPKFRKNNFFHYFCIECECLFISPKPSKKYLKEMYEEEEYLTVYLEKKGVKRYCEMLAKKLAAVSEKGRLLEIGSNVGWFLSAMEKIGWAVLGVETSEKACDVANTLPNLQHLTVQGSILDKNIQKKVEAFNPYDLIVLHQTLEHFSDPKALIRKLLPLLVQEGRISIVVPDMGQSTGITEFPHLNGTFAGEHCTLFTAKTMKKLAADCNLKIVHHETFKSSCDFWVVLQKQE